MKMGSYIVDLSVLCYNRSHNGPLKIGPSRARVVSSMTIAGCADTAGCKIKEVTDMKALVLAEKPSVARDIARVLKCGKNNNGSIEGPAYIVTWGLGHLVTLADPEDYDKKYKEWKMEDLPMMPEPFKLEVIGQTAKQYQAVKAQLFRKDVGEVIIATDAGREGELVARLILQKAGEKALDLLCDGQGDPGGLCPSKGRAGV